MVEEESVCGPEPHKLMFPLQHRLCHRRSLWQSSANPQDRHRCTTLHPQCGQTAAHQLKAVLGPFHMISLTKWDPQFTSTERQMSVYARLPPIRKTKGNLSPSIWVDRRTNRVAVTCHPPTLLIVARDWLPSCLSGPRSSKGWAPLLYTMSIT